MVLVVEQADRGHVAMDTVEVIRNSASDLSPFSKIISILFIVIASILNKEITTILTYCNNL